MRLTLDQQFINAVRALIGVGPLYGVEQDNQLASHGYWRLEALCRLAKPDCTSCGGCGYVDRGARIEDPCECTGKVYAKRGESTSPKAIARRKKAQDAQASSD